MKAFFKKNVKHLPSLFILIGFIYLTLHYFDAQYLWKSTNKMFAHPILLLSIFVIYFISFCFKAVAWKLYFRGKARFTTCLLGILYSLLINHLLPIKLGDLFRIKVLSTRDSHIKDQEAFQSVIVLRLIDMLTLTLITLVGLLSLGVKFRIPVWMIVIGGIGSFLCLLIINKYFPSFLKRHLALMKKAFSGMNGIGIILFTVTSWILEAGVLYGTVMALDGDLSFFKSVIANSFTIAGQVFQITPGGLANYESFLVFALGLMDFSIKEGYMVAVLTHAMKFMFSYTAGFIAFINYPISLKTMKEWVKVRGVMKE
ncbi:lysylphosphatidylglycerol synthase transmembrane domain-containing protein [Peribacillus alkalitolerans]|uniref:lysylphosphatidylglycerol synthase transmembrane domain-containing protein n=1 Tax=Peribacillus alkalitolerans TaxID=1550385 RepID=UPI0013D51D92|nr:lysylphosphatidylglycerol synthase transmembrane domain-containing protein [Peribacillus alkalitolerans]